jgi:TRAP-type C4-dicarboxylate transport system permease small subunit
MSESFRWLGRFVELVAVLLRMSLVLSMAMMVFCISYQVLMRYIFSMSPPWSEELALLMFSWATLGGLALGVYEGFHVRLDLLLNALAETPQLWLERLIGFSTMLFGAYLTWSGWRFVDVTSGSTSAAIGYPIEVLHSLAPICGALICLFAGWRLVSPLPTTATTDLAP